MALNGKFQQELAWNLVSLGIMGASGILLNILIALFYEPAHLGIFNQAFAVYIFSSQLGAAGIPVSTLKYVAEFSLNKNRCQTIMVTGLLVAAFSGITVSCLLYYSRGLIASLLASPGMVSAVAWISPGLFFFIINKVLLNILNGQRRMKAFAVLQSLRYCFMVGIFFFLANIKWPGASLSVVFTVAEVLLFFCSLPLLLPLFFPIKLKDIRYWTVCHVEFGTKSFLSGMLLELNSRVDVLMLGYFSTDTVVGVYSFSAILAEGVFQILVVVIRNVTPILVRLISLGKIDELKQVITKTKHITFFSMVVVGTVLVGTYPLLIHMLTNKIDLYAGWPVFSILVCGIVAASGYLPFRNILQAGGYPGWHTIMISFLVVINIVLNALFIPQWGMEGAAVATAISMVLLILLLRGMANRVFGFRILE